jgi:hypothetical protein
MCVLSDRCVYTCQPDRDRARGGTAPLTARRQLTAQVFAAFLAAVLHVLIAAGRAPCRSKGSARRLHQVRPPPHQLHVRAPSARLIPELAGQAMVVCFAPVA